MIPSSELNSRQTSVTRKLDIGKTLENHTFFQNEDAGLIEKLTAEMQTRVYNDKDTIIKKGEVGRAMFIVLKGEVHVVSDDGLSLSLECLDGRDAIRWIVFFYLPHNDWKLSRPTQCPHKFS